MKKILLSVSFLATLASQAQNPVTYYLPLDDSSYTIFDTATPLNQTASGANVAWNFTDLVEVGGTLIEVYPATTDIATQFPNTTTVVQQPGAAGDAYLFVAQSGNNVALTGADSGGILLEYTNNALIGALPMNFGYTQTDAMSGTYTYDTFSGPFTGTVSTNVDAYGTLTINGGAPVAVTRVKVVQNISLTYMGIPNIGTGVQTTYSYYREDGILYFTTTTLTISAPLAGINETITTMMKFEGILLGTPETASSKLVLYPNPSSGLVNIQGDSLADLVQIADVSGKVVKTIKQPNGQIDLSELTSGLYIATITSAGQTSTQKLVIK